MSRRHPDGDRVGGGAGAQGRTGPSAAAARDSPDPRVRTLADRVAQLEEELERKERRHRDVVRRYERLLADARGGDRADGAVRADGSDGSRDRGPLAWLRALLCR